VNDLQGGEKHDAFPDEAFVLRGEAIVIEAMQGEITLQSAEFSVC
jgi:hypothetical protein